MTPPASTSLENFLKSSFFLFSIALQSVAMKKLANNHFATRQSLGIRTSWGRLLFFCALASGPWAGFSLSPLAHGAQAAGIAFNSLVPIVRRAERVGVSLPL